MSATTPRLSPRPDGLLEAAAPVAVPFMAPRLQGSLSEDGRLDLALWAAGDLGSLRVDGLGAAGVVAPNRWETDSAGLHVAQSQPILLLRGARAGRFTPAARSAGWAAPGPAPSTQRQGPRRVVELGWGVVIVETRGDDTVVAVGADRAEAEAALTLPADAIVAEAAAHVARCDRMPGADPLLRSMVLQGTHAGLSSIRKDQHGRFAGLAAGLAYSSPARSYFRDGYWTLQLLLQADPRAVKDEIDLLAQGVHADGEAPSGVILSGPAQSAAWEALRQRSRRMAAAHRPGDWWSDHFDSPLFFVLMIGDYVRATGDRSPAERHAGRIAAVFERYARFAADSADGLPAKPRHDRDWADNVLREGEVAYDLGLWIGALRTIVELGGPLAARADAMAADALPQFERLWLGDHYADWRRPDGSAEPHLTLDSLTLLRADAAPTDKAQLVLERARMTLESRRNSVQRWGDWGMLCAFPPFARREDTRAKSAFAYRYHNGADWPWLDGLYARERLRRGLPGWRYPLLRWWQTCLGQGWAGPVEYFSPPFGRGSLLQGWSGFPAAVALEFADTVLAGDPEP